MKRGAAFPQSDSSVFISVHLWLYLSILFLHLELRVDHIVVAAAGRGPGWLAVGLRSAVACGGAGGLRTAFS